MANNDVGMFGSELRQAVSDPNADKAATPVAPGQVPVGGVITPMNSDFSKVGQDDSTAIISNLLGSAGTIVSDYLDRKKDQYNLDGQMAYAQGKTQDEITANGNQYTMAGFMSMKARVASNDWYQNALNDINNQDKTLDPTAYAQKLSKSYASMQDSVAGSDPFTKNLMTTLASENFPKLAAQQVQSNNAWKQQQTMSSYTDMLVSEAAKDDPASPETPADKQARLHQLTSPSYSGLPDVLHKEAVTQAVQLSLKLGNDSLFKSLGTSESERIAAMNLGGATPELNQAVQTVGAPPLVNAVMKVESKGNPDAVSAKGAVGSMQTMPATLADPGFGVRPAQNNSPEEKARVGRDYLQAMLGKYDNNQTLALMAYNAGPATVDAQIAKVGNPGVDDHATAAFVNAFPYKETRDYVAKVQSTMNATPGAATTVPVAVTPTGSNGQMTVAQAKNMGGDTFNSARANAEGNTPGQMAAPTTLLNVANSAMTTKTAAFSALLNAGYTPAQVETISSSYTAFQDKKTQNFNTQRIMDEEAVKVAAQQTGNLPAALNTISELKEKNGYSDAWANGLANTAASEVQAGLLKRQAQVRLTNAISTDTLKNLASGELPDALTIARAQISGSVNGATPPSDLPPDQVKKWQDDQFREKYSAKLIKNGVVDTTWGATMNSAFEGPLLDPKTGKITSAAASAYDDYQYLSKQASPAYADQFLSDSAKSTVAKINIYAAEGMNSAQAMNHVANAQSMASNIGPDNRKIDVDDIHNQASSVVNTMTPDFWSLFSNGHHYATNWWDVRDEDVDRIKADPLLPAAISNRAMQLIHDDPSMPTKAAVGQASRELQAQSDYALGNVLIAKPGHTIAGDMGLHNSAQGAVNEALTLAVMQNGHNWWKGQWDSATSTFAQFRGYDEYGNPKYLLGNKQTGFPEFSAKAVSASVRDAISSMPAVKLIYNSNDETYTFDLYTNKEHTATANNPITVKASSVGELGNMHQLTKKSFIGGMENAAATTMTVKHNSGIFGRK